MKAKFNEHEGCFSIDLEAETMQEAAALTRFGTNRTGVRSITAYAGKDGVFSSSVVFGKHKRNGSDIQKRK